MMKQQEVFTKIGGIIKEINEQYQYLETIGGHLNDLELELFVANTHFLADHAEVLRKLNLQNAPAKPIEEGPVVPQESVKEAPITQPPSHEEVFFEPVIQTGNALPKDEPKPEVIRHELEIDDNWQEDDEVTVDEHTVADAEEVSFDDNADVDVPAPAVTAPVEEVKQAEDTVSTSSKADVDEVYTINQKISAQMGKQEPALLPITDLKSAITLNDKLLFIKDLFNGYSLAYSEAIEILNRFSGFEEADTFLKKNYAAKNNWENKTQTAEKFYDLLKRRYL